MPRPMETKRTSEGIATLVAPSPETTTAEAAQLARQYFGVVGEASRVAGEKDGNFVIRAGGSRYFLKVIHPEEPAEVTDLGTAVLEWLANSPDLPVQALVPALDGSPDVRAQVGGVERALRMTTYLDGRLLRTVPTSAALRANLGALLAQVGLALKPFQHEAANRVLLWDIQHAGKARLMLEELHDLARREMLEAVLDRFEQMVWPKLRSMRAQVVHHDLSADNVLVADDETTITGILDFGDVVRTQLVNDVAIAASSQLADGPDPMGPVLNLVRGYHRVVPLTDEELRLIYDLVCVRTVIRIIISEWRSRRFPENRGYIMRNTPRAWEHLRNMPAAQGPSIYERLAAACMVR